VGEDLRDGLKGGLTGVLLLVTEGGRQDGDGCGVGSGAKDGDV
jgi:hypothetical protein